MSAATMSDTEQMAVYANMALAEVGAKQTVYADGRSLCIALGNRDHYRTALLAVLKVTGDRTRRVRCQAHLERGGRAACGYIELGDAIRGRICDKATR